LSNKLGGVRFVSPGEGSFKLPSRDGGDPGASPMGDCPVHSRPRVQVAFDLNHDVSVSGPGPGGAPSTIASTAAGFAHSLTRRPAPHLLRTLQGVRGVLVPGTATLVLASPGAGSTTLLRLISARQPCGPGDVLTYNGATAGQLREDGVAPLRLLVFGSATDEHEPLLTARESLAFAAAARDVYLPKGEPGADVPFCSCGGARLAPSAEAVLSCLHMTEAGDTLVGSPATVRGLSGGQRRRLTVGEAILADGRVLALDNPTTGLDAGTAEAVVAGLVSWARATGGTLIAALQQPTPSMLSAFDACLLLSAGRALFWGPVPALEPYLASLGFARPSYMDVADWASEIASDPARAAVLSLEDRGLMGDGDGSTSDARIPTLLTVPDLAAHWAASGPPPVTPSSQLAGAVPSPSPPAMPSPPPIPLTPSTPVPPPGPVDLGSPYLRARYGLRRSFLRHAPPIAALLLARQFAILRRNHVLILARLGSSILMGIVLATVFEDAPPAIFSIRFGLTLFSCIFLGFSNNAELPMSFLSRRVVWRHVDAGLYSPAAYLLALVTVSLPLLLLNDAVYGSLVYWPTNYAPEASRFFFYLLVITLVDLSMGAYLRALAYATPSMERAGAVGQGIIGIWLLFAGFYIIRSQAPQWLVWLAWVSPFFWAVCAVTNSEFSAPRYAAPPPGAPPGSTSAGQLYMSSFDYPFGLGYQWGGVAFLFGFFCLVTLLLGPLALSRVRYEDESGTTRRLEGEKDEGHEEAVEEVEAARARQAKRAAQAVGQATGEASAEGEGSDTPGRAAASPSVAVPFVPVTLAFRDVEYEVRVKGGQRKLLQRLAGFARPGRLTALMGATGAGKTTLLDVLAGRKTTGTVRGTFTVNGTPAGPRQLATLTAYAEQEDSHVPLATVREALAFSASLRFRPPPGASSTAARSSLVSRILAVLELEGISRRVVSSLSRGQAKLLTVGVELTSNPSILFADEPTSYLQSRDAASVMHVLRRVAQTGRTVICTIHQPSAQVFFGFDDLVLLAPGGELVFAGPIGHHASRLVTYLSSLPGAPLLPPAVNPGTWQLAVITAVAEKAEGEPLGAPPFSFADHFAASEEGRAYAAELADAMAVAPSSLPAVPTVPRPWWKRAGKFQRSLPASFAAVGARAATESWRNVDVFYSRLLVDSFIALLFGLLFIQNDLNTYSGTQSGLGYLVGSVAFGGIIFLTTGISTYGTRRSAFYRERAAGAYPGLVWPVVLLLTELPHAAFVTLIFACIAYWVAGLRSSAAAFFFYWAAGLLLGATYFVSMALAVTGLLPTMAVAQIVGGLSISLTFLFSGLFAPPSQIPPFWIGLYYAVPTSHILRAQAVAQFYCVGGAAAGCPTITLTSASPPIDRYAYVLNFLGMSSYTGGQFAWEEVGYAVAGVAVVAFVGAAAYTLLNYAHK